MAVSVGEPDAVAPHPDPDAVGPRASGPRAREVLGDWLIVIGALGLFVSLFLTWSHQFSHAFLDEFGLSDALRGIPRDPTAWQVYSVADVLLALLAGALVVVALVGHRRTRIVVTLAASVALAFTLRAVSAPPSNGANIFNPALNVPNYFPNTPTAGVGETLAIIGLGLALIGLVLTFEMD